MNLDDFLTVAQSNSDGWTASAALQAAKAMISSPVTVVDWDAGAGEEWIRLVSDDHVIALISVKLPIAIVERTSNKPLSDTSITVVYVDSLDDENLTAHRPVLEAAFQETDRLDSLDLTGFSANDLWYSTV